MRTTLTLEDDLAEALNRNARLTGRSFKAVLNETIRRGLAHGDKPAEGTIQPFVVEPQACGLMAGIDPLRSTSWWIRWSWRASAQADTQG